ncbi:hypothetical protein KRX57_08130 [Weeksellaceae bacterium TAE3-ERU29]|nr:hypothetical protein [Weeksellaceae bacterium TAE3-ERU29]
MGFNISGLAINKNYEKDFDQLQEELGWKLRKESEIDFETASSNWTEEGVCNVYFTEKGTLMFIDMDMCTESYPLKNDNTLTFALSETSMAFNLNYCEKGIEKRTIMEVDGERMEDEGEKLEVEDESEDVSEIIWNQIGKVIGKSFWDIELDEKAVQYVFVKEEFNPDRPFKNYTLSELDRIFYELISISDIKTNQMMQVVLRRILEEYKNRDIELPTKRGQSIKSPNKKWWQFWK